MLPILRLLTCSATNVRYLCALLACSCAHESVMCTMLIMIIAHNINIKILHQQLQEWVIVMLIIMIRFC